MQKGTLYATCPGHVEYTLNHRCCVGWEAAKSIPLGMRPKKKIRRFGHANKEKESSSKVEICGQILAEKKTKLEQDRFAHQRVDEVFEILDDEDTSVNSNLFVITVCN